MRHANKALAFAAVVVLLPLLYFLSLGPGVRLLPHQVWEPYYAPAYLVASRSDVFDQGLQSYLQLWQPTPILQPIPSPYYQFESVQYFPPGPEFPLSNAAAQVKTYPAAAGSTP